MMSDNETMQIEPTTVNNTLSYIGGVVIAGAAALGIGNLLLAIYNRRSGKQDKQDELHETNRGKELDATSGFQDRLIKRVENLEDELGEMRTEQLEQIRTNTRLTVENENLRNENIRQEGEIKELQGTVHRLETELKVILAQSSPLADGAARTLRIEAANIIENIGHMSFVPTGEPTPDDLSANRRLKEIRESAARMQEVIE